MVTFHSFEEMESELDNFINSFLSVLPQPPHRDDPMTMTHHLRFMSTGNNNMDWEPPRRVRCPFENNNDMDHNVDRLVQQLSLQAHPAHFPAVSEMLNAKGRDMMTAGVTEPAVEMGDTRMIATARRLQEVTPQTLHTIRSSFLPFAEADCLEQAYQDRRVSQPCEQTLDNLHAVRSDALLQLQQAQQEESEVLYDLFLLYALVFGTILLVVIKSRKFLKRQIRLRNNIIITLYSKPALKSAMEKAMGGKSIGHTPPLQLRRDVRSQALMRSGFRCRMAIFSIMTIVYFVAPSKVLPFACAVAGFCFCAVLLSVLSKRSSMAKVNECTCCCCGTTTTEAAQGLGNACCCCCSGTGVCSLECAACCNPDSDDDDDDDTQNDKGCCCCCCCCGADGGCCCNNNESGCCNESKPVKRATVVTVTDNEQKDGMVAYESVPVVMVV